ncbi:MAG: hypothetical protein C4532_14830 [Candidatus Abyssobacteria bacterium SURF_17]|uniref:Uncharacterized protein n=1 Tax=Candidatus Abyssobacteria bacterium SURF_17 TaxID=2093361 RepID=A0A419ETL5_9BACT|nr:MAG: hypothetical protein C4532_14830 [Candidatus Abyssubacteria bacterium SURF_17]
MMVVSSDHPNHRCRHGAKSYYSGNRGKAREMSVVNPAGKQAGFNAHKYAGANEQRSRANESAAAGCRAGFLIIGRRIMS